MSDITVITLTESHVTNIPHKPTLGYSVCDWKNCKLEIIFNRLEYVNL